MVSLQLLVIIAFPLATVHAARMDYDVSKIIQEFRNPSDDLKILCAHRGLRWNGTTENSRDSYFRAAQNGIECIETDMWLSRDGKVVMMHDTGYGRATDVGEQNKQAAYSPYTGEGYNPPVSEVDYVNHAEQYHLRDEEGRVREEHIPLLDDMLAMIKENGLNVVLQLDFKEKAAIAPAYEILKKATNADGIPAMEWCIWKLYAVWFPRPDVLEAESWVQDAFANFGSFLFIPVWEPSTTDEYDQLLAMKEYDQTNYTISYEVEMRDNNAPLQRLVDWVHSDRSVIKGSGTYYAPGDFLHNRDGPVYIFHEGDEPERLDDVLPPNSSRDGKDHRSDFSWIISNNYSWIITDTADLWHTRLSTQGLRNMSKLLKDDATPLNETIASGWFKRDHPRDWLSGSQ